MISCYKKKRFNRGEAMRILLCSNYPVFTGSGGAEKVFWDMGDHFATEGNEVMCLGFEKGADPEKAAFHYHGNLVKIANPGRYYKKSRLVQLLTAMMFFCPQTRRKIRDSLEGRRKGQLIQGELYAFMPDVIVSFQIDMTYILRHCIKTKTPVITALHCDIDTLLRGKQRMYKALESSEAIVVLMRSYLDVLKRYIKDTSKAVFISNAVPQLQGNFDNSARVIVGAGRICPQKNQLFAIKAFAIFSKGHPDWILRFYGDTSYDKEYFELCKKEAVSLGIENRVFFMGTTKRLHEEILKASIFAFPSVFEGFSLALTEAMALGMPCVCLKTCTGITELIENGKNGILSDPNPEVYAKALANLSDDKERRLELGKMARESMEQYSPQKVYGIWNRVLQDARSLSFGK